jgi:glycosyltransferase involved in cell wall biosynthesis
MRFLPPAARRQIAQLRQNRRLRTNQFDLGAIRPFRTFDGTHVVVAGIFRANSGLARAAELVALTLERRGSRVTRVDVTAAIGLRLERDDIGMATPQNCLSMIDVTDVVVVTNPDQPSLAAFDLNWLVGRTIIGHWIWELETLPKFWGRAARSFDEIWGATELLTDCFRRSLLQFDRPIQVVSYGVADQPFPKVSSAQRSSVRSQLNIAETAYVAGYSFSVDSNFYRKNPVGAVCAFQSAFPDRTGSEMLLLRCNDFSHRPLERREFMALIAGDQRIRIHDETHPIGIGDFYRAIDVYLSSSRCEGYGLNLVEASQSGLPVITPAWRIAPEILSLPGMIQTSFTLVPVVDPQGHYTDLKTHWAEPNIDDLARALIQIKAATGLSPPR